MGFIPERRRNDVDDDDVEVYDDDGRPLHLVHDDDDVDVGDADSYLH